ncbi:MAG: glycosyltransferase family 39 protein [Pyrinomonadaceae bacterium]
MNALLLAVALLLLAAISVLTPADGTPAALLALPLVAVATLAVYRLNDDRKFLVRLFFSALLVRVLIGTCIYVFHWQVFFGGDALTYDFLGYGLLNVWSGNLAFQRSVDLFTGGGSASGWGMLYMVASIYKIVGRNMLATQYVNCLLGAATAILAYMISMEIFPTRRVARVCALMTAFFPSLVLWSCQGLKDGPIVFLLALSMLATLKLGNRFSIKYLTALALALCCLITLRFYVFYIVAIAVTAAFILGRRRLTAQSFARQLVVMIAIGAALAYFGVSYYTTQQFEKYGSTEQLQRMRLDAVQSAQSGFGKDVDVTTPGGVVTAIPTGLTYLLLAPFPWELSSLRQMITLPEMIVWWSSLPILVLGGWFTIKHRLREIAPILIFTTLLTLTYSITQGNVGTAYRQRAQLLVFYFVFVAVGFILVKEKREANARKKRAEREAFQRPRFKPEQPNDQMPAAG